MTMADSRRLRELACRYSEYGYRKDYFIEFVFRDTDLLSGAMVDRLAQACDMVRELTGHPEGSKA